MPIKRLTPDGHLNLVERILHHIVCVELVDAPKDHVCVGLLGIGEDQEFDAFAGRRKGLTSSTPIIEYRRSKLGVCVELKTHLSTSENTASETDHSP